MIDIPAPDGHVWLRLAKPRYGDPFDTSFARQQGGRWNPPGSWPTLYVNEDMPTVHAQVRHLFLGRGVEPDDLDDATPILLAAAHVHDVGLRGVWWRSAALVGRELAWFPAVRATVRALWRDPKPYGSWWYARTLDEVR